MRIVRRSIRGMRIILRSLRRSPILDALFGKTKQQILAAILLQPARAWYLLELAQHLRLRPSSLQRELKRLTEAGLLKRRQDGRRVYFQADTTCPLFLELSQILIKTVGIVDALKQALEPLRREIDIAFIYGSIASSSERSSSDIDLLTIGSAPLSRVAPLLRDLERKMGRSINPSVYAQEEFRKRVRRENHFLTSLLREQPLFIMGGPDELAKLTAGTPAQTASHQRSRIEQSARRR